MKFDPTPLIRPNFCGPLVTVLTGFHCINNGTDNNSYSSNSNNDNNNNNNNNNSNK